MRFNRTSLIALALLGGCGGNESASEEGLAEAPAGATQAETSQIAAPASLPPLEIAGVQSALRSLYPEPGTQFATAATDLDGDGAQEVLAYAYGPSICGTGGCSLVVLAPAAGAYRVVAQTSVTQEPIGVLDTSSNGWKDLSVGIGGGGGKAAQVRLRFDGANYPENPTVLPDDATIAETDGTILISDPLQGSPLPAV